MFVRKNLFKDVPAPSNSSAVSKRPITVNLILHDICSNPHHPIRLKIKDLVENLPTFTDLCRTAKYPRVVSSIQLQPTVRIPYNQFVIDKRNQQVRLPPSQR